VVDVAYANRTDLNNAVKQAEFKNQPYGQATAQRRAQRAVPPGPPPTETDTAGPVAGGLTPLDAPTQRPAEPVTTGLPFGAGAGPEALGATGIQPGSREDVILRVRAMAARYPNPALIAVLQALESKR
jgi:hypothetical protein